MTGRIPQKSSSRSRSIGLRDRSVCVEGATLSARSASSHRNGPLKPVTAEWAQRFEQSILANEFIVTLLERMQRSDLPQWYLSGGCLFQTVWNLEVVPWPAMGVTD